jgi:hypothetical protein
MSLYNYLLKTTSKSCLFHIFLVVAYIPDTEDVRFYTPFNKVAETTTNPKILTDILRRGNNDDVSRSAAQNPNCPPELLAEVLKRDKDDWFSSDAAENPNCPFEAKFKWMRDNGKITKYDPNKHKIDKVEVKEVEEDEDLKNLEELLSFNLNKF